MVRRSVQTREPATQTVQPTLVWIGLFYLGAVTALPTWLDTTVWIISGSLLLSMVLAFVGWHRLDDWTDGKAYFGLAVMVAMLAAVSGISAWSWESSYTAVTFGIALVLILPGLVGLLRDPYNRRALILGLALGTAVYGIVAMARVLAGDPVLDQEEGRGLAKILGVNRNTVNLRIIVVVPFLVWWVRERIFSPHRWLLLPVVVFPILATGGRAGLVGLSCGLLLYALLQPGIGRKSRALLLVLLVGGATLVGARGSSGPLGTGLERITSYVLGERTGSDEARELLAQKAWAVAKANPVFGIGLGNFRGLGHPVAEEASTERVRRVVRVGTAHNTYAQTLAELGLVGGFSTFALFAWALAIGIRGSRHRDIRLATASFGGFLVAIFFDSALGGSLVLVTIALVLASTLEARGSLPPGAT